MALKQFLTTLDQVLPRPEALPFINDAKTLAYIQGRARNRYRADEVLIGKEVGEKVRRLIDDHSIAADVLPFTRLEAVADRLLELAKANRHRLTR